MVLGTSLKRSLGRRRVGVRGLLLQSAVSFMGEASKNFTYDSKLPILNI